MAVHLPTYFAAVFSICGIANAERYVAKASNIPLWIFHGADDNAVAVEPNRILYKTLIENGGNVQYTEYVKTGHNSWDAAFSEPGLLIW